MTDSPEGGFGVRLQSRAAASHSRSDSATKIPTALIPAGVGLLFELFGAISLSKPGLRKLLMHLAAMLGVLGTIGGFAPAVMRKFDFSQTAVIVGLAMSVICLVFTLLCVRSFIAARKARQAAQ